MTEAVVGQDRRKKKLNATWWRTWHRWVALPATLFLCFVAVTGVMVAFSEFFGEAEALREATRDLVSPVRAGDDFSGEDAKLAAALGAVATQARGAPIDKIEMQFKGDHPTVAIFTGKPSGGEDRRYMYDVSTGHLTISPYADKPLIHRIHSGEAFGDGGLVVAMIWGSALAFLSLSGFLVYLTLYRSHRPGIRRFFW